MIQTLLEKYAVGMTIITVCLVVYLIFEILHKRHKHKRKSILVHVIQTIVLCVIVLAIAQTVDMAASDFELSFISTPLINLVAISAITLIIMRKLFQLANRLEKQQIKKGSDPTSARIIARIFKTTVFVIIVLLFGEHFGMSLSGLMAFGGLGGIAIGMAGKDILSNFFSGIMLYFDRPFNIGDWVSSPDRNIEGTVVEIGWRLTKIVTFDHRPLYIPNSLFSSISVENPGRMTNRRIKTEIGLRYEDSDKISAIVDDIRTMLKQDENIDTGQTLLVYFDAFADSSLNIMVYCFTKTTVWAEWLDAQQTVYLKIIEIVKKHGADFAFPSQTLYVEKNQ
ncbi:MscS family inner membrane protein YnaI [Providencia rustigianii]|uniref:Transporter, small conductance mechanosensitive ion channel MscS family protein n=3 Tax=Providencia rustigianii TaxID=158850 RepID=D1P6W1_9GAMM|nr:MULTISPECIES: mechanosensitive ion channel family protein [Providencia]EFB70808.1 transporter, small conductance mechanosensitive ion channel MscS family protein [Providencia rustigianii DSM 4541]MTC56191.1 mechanosensitive ion channel [Providencia rustigianii]MTC59741.1 mechanosensitive ion channel [Providencia rustigianii]SPY76428.1 MscS family inner membrane protein YnaI [Providencia rustigianii]SUC34390.1 MscS family inner membrane protein YnaI [Providencia rustigianii]